jgi:glutathione S-transferase
MRRNGDPTPRRRIRATCVDVTFDAPNLDERRSPSVKLYLSPGACSLSPHIVLRELGLPFEAVRVNLQAKKTQAGDDFLAVNPKGYVPTLDLGDGKILTEGPAIVQYLADQKPESKLAPAAGSFDRVRLWELLNFISTEIHKGFSPLFSPALSDDAKKPLRDRLVGRLGAADKMLEGKDYLMGSQFTVADAYLFTVLRWTNPLKIDIQPFANLRAYLERVGARPAVKAALEAEAQK